MASSAFEPPAFPEIAPLTWIPPSVFFYAALVVAVATALKSYTDLFFACAEKFPRGLVVAYNLSAWALIYVALVIVEELRLPDEPPIIGFQMIRSTLLLGYWSHRWQLGTRVVFLVFGPFLVLPPVRKVEVTSAVARAVVGTAQRRETRYTALAVFTVICAAQGFVAYSIYLVMSRIFVMDLANLLGIVAFYVLVVFYYLLCFYATMMRTAVVIGGTNMLDILRSSFTVRYRGRTVDLLDTRAYLYLYLGAFSITVAGALAMILYNIIEDVQAYNAAGSGVDPGILAIIIVFFVLCVAVIVSATIFILNEAFRVKVTTVVVASEAPGKRMEAEETAEDEDDGEPSSAGYLALGGLEPSATKEADTLNMSMALQADDDMPARMARPISRTAGRAMESSHPLPSTSAPVEEAKKADGSRIAAAPSQPAVPSTPAAVPAAPAVPSTPAVQAASGGLKPAAPSPGAPAMPAARPGPPPPQPSMPAAGLALPPPPGPAAAQSRPPMPGPAAAQPGPPMPAAVRLELEDMPMPMRRSEAPDTERERRSKKAARKSAAADESESESDESLVVADAGRWRLHVTVRLQSPDGGLDPAAPAIVVDGDFASVRDLVDHVGRRLGVIVVELRFADTLELVTDLSVVRANATLVAITNNII